MNPLNPITKFAKPRPAAELLRNVQHAPSPAPGPSVKVRAELPPSLRRADAAETFRPMRPVESDLTEEERKGRCEGCEWFVEGTEATEPVCIAHCELCYRSELRRFPWARMWRCPRGRWWKEKEKTHHGDTESTER